MRIRADAVTGALLEDLASSDTVMRSEGLMDLPIVAAPDIAAITVFRRSPTNRVVAYEIPYVIEHAAGSDTATILRAQEDSQAHDWMLGDQWVHGITVTDYATLAATTAAYRHVQAIPATEWLIPHNLGFWPNVAAVDSSGETVIGRIEYLDVNTVRLTFSAPFAGEAYLS